MKSRCVLKAAGKMLDSKVPAHSAVKRFPWLHERNVAIVAKKNRGLRVWFFLGFLGLCVGFRVRNCFAAGMALSPAAHEDGTCPWKPSAP